MENKLICTTSAYPVDRNQTVLTCATASASLAPQYCVWHDDDHPYRPVEQSPYHDPDRPDGGSDVTPAGALRLGASSARWVPKRIEKQIRKSRALVKRSIKQSKTNERRSTRKSLITRCCFCCWEFRLDSTCDSTNNHL